MDLHKDKVVSAFLDGNLVDSLGENLHDQTSAQQIKAIFITIKKQNLFMECLIAAKYFMINDFQIYVTWNDLSDGKWLDMTNIMEANWFKTLQ